MDINSFRQILEAMASRPLDNPQGDLAPEAAPDMSGGAGGIGADAHALRPADQSGELPDAMPAPIADAPAGIGADPHALRKLDQKQGDIAEEEDEKENGESDEDCGTMAEEFAKHIAEHVSFEIEFKDSGLIESLQLDEALAAQAAAALQSTINEAATAHAAKLNLIAGTIMEQLVTAKIQMMEQKVDQYLDSVVTEWMEENRLAVEQGIRTEIAESFMEEMKSVFERHYVEMPKAKRDLYEEAISKGEEIFTKLTEAEAAKQALEAKLQVAEKRLVVEGVVAGMVATKAHKLRELAESIEFGADFETKLRSLAEEVTVPEAAPAVATISSPIVEDVSGLISDMQEDRREKFVDPTVSRYASFLDRM